MQYIFTFTTGRSGTAQLTNILNTCRDVVAEHEPPPICNGRIMRFALKGVPGVAIPLTRKRLAVQRRARQSGAERYGDISHVFGKWYGEDLVGQLGACNCYVIELERDPVQVIASFFAMGCIPGNGWGNHWLGNPQWRRVMFRFAPENPYEAIAWHVYELRARLNRFRKIHPNCTYAKLRFEELTDASSCFAWLETHGFKPTEYTGQIVHTKSNDKYSQKIQRPDYAAAACASKRCETLLRDQGLL